MTYRIEPYIEGNPSFARIIIAEEWEGKPKESKKLLEQLCQELPKDKKVKFLVTPGGFIRFEWPLSISEEDIGDSKNPNKNVVNSLVEEAKKLVNSILNQSLVKDLNVFADYLTLGIDCGMKNRSENKIDDKKPHIEFVFLINLKNNEKYWTGKSYATKRQERKLIHIVDHESHFVDLEDIGMVMILGCYDLNIFNNRSKTPEVGERAKFKEDFRALTKEKKPVFVLHHPHTTIKTQTWKSSWNKLERDFKVKQYAGSGVYYEAGKAPNNLEVVLKKTKLGNSIDFIVKK